MLKNDDMLRTYYSHYRIYIFMTPFSDGFNDSLFTRFFVQDCWQGNRLTHRKPLFRLPPGFFRSQIYVAIRDSLECNENNNACFKLVPEEQDITVTGIRSIFDRAGAKING